LWTTLEIDKPHLVDKRRFNSPIEPSADIIIRYLIDDFSSFRYMTIVSTATRFGNGTESDVNGSNVTDS